MKLLFLNVQVIKKLKKLHDISSRLLVPERVCESPAQLTGVMTYVHIHTLFSWRACWDVGFRGGGWKTDREDGVWNVIQKWVSRVEEGGGKLNNKPPPDRAGENPFFESGLLDFTVLSF